MDKLDTPWERRDLNKYPNGKDIQDEYAEYCSYCRRLGKEPQKWLDWNYCTYSGFSESWRLNH